MHTLIIRTAFSNCGEPQPCFPTKTRLPFYSQAWAGLGQCCLLPHRLRTGCEERFQNRVSGFAIFGMRTFGAPGIPFFLKARTRRLKPWGCGLWGPVGESVLWLGWGPNFGMLWGFLAPFPIEQTYCPNLLVSQVEMISPVRISLQGLFPCFSFLFAARSFKLGGNWQLLVFSKNQTCTFKHFPGERWATVCISCEVTWRGGLTKSLGTQRLWVL